MSYLNQNKAIWSIEHSVQVSYKSTTSRERMMKNRTRYKKAVFQLNTAKNTSEKLIPYDFPDFTKSYFFGKFAWKILRFSIIFKVM